MTKRLANSWTTVFLFIIFATLLNLLIGFLIKKETLPIALTIDYNPAQFKFIKIWVKFALVIGIIFPLILLAIGFNEPISRQIWDLYLLVLGLQIISEDIVFNRFFCDSMKAIVSIIYVPFRIYQLWEGLQILNYTQIQLGLFWIILAFWIANLIMLMTVPVPIIIKNNLSLKKESNSVY